MKKPLKELCKCKKFSGYTEGYFCRKCKMCIYTKKQIAEIDMARKLESDTKRIWEKANLTDANVSYLCGEYNGKLDNQERIKDLFREIVKEIYTYGNFMSDDRTGKLMDKIEEL